MSAPAGVARYQQADVYTMSPARRLVLMYTHLLLNLRQAHQAMERREIERRSGHVAKAMDILHELLSSLDHEQGGALADHLAALYVFMIGELAAADARADLARIRPLITMVDQLHEAWSAAAKELE
jgi:flagellar secretion chaperone FliS